MVGHRERFQPHIPKELGRYLIPTESIIFLVRRHWIVLLEPILTAIAGLIIVALVTANASGVLVKIVLALWAVALLRLTFHIFEWRHEVFLATNSRLMLVHGILTRKVDIMPMAKVTDMRYDRSMIGQIFGYGVFILESAGQDQALSKINFISNPDLHYQQISAVIFAPAQRRHPDRMAPASTGSRLPIGEVERVWWRRS
jgi:membrane protein YdbS with pleckstrin-like domain